MLKILGMSFKKSICLICSCIYMCLVEHLTKESWSLVAEVRGTVATWEILVDGLWSYSFIHTKNCIFLAQN